MSSLTDRLLAAEREAGELRRRVTGYDLRPAVLDIIMAAAAQHAPAMTSQDMAFAIGIGIDKRSVDSAIASLVRREIIGVEHRGACSRRFTVLASGLSTDWTDLKRQAREREGALRKRPCITCRAVFVSEGPHNRMCVTCRSGRHGKYEDPHRIAY